MRTIAASRLLSSVLSLATLAVASVVGGVGSACHETECNSAGCKSYEDVVESCDGRSNCREIEDCDVTVACAIDEEECAALRACPPGYAEAETCPEGVACEVVEACGSSTLCTPEVSCASNSDCIETYFCDFADGRCGAGEPGTCRARPEFCSDGVEVCFCDGTTSDLGCVGLSGRDHDDTGSCVVPPGKFACGHFQCPATSLYCKIVTSDTAELDDAQCDIPPPGCATLDCACLADVAAACGGTCDESSGGVVVRCPGG
jgi:hypothetical protein